MHPIGQILNFDEKREFQMRGVEHSHCALHVKNAPKFDEDPDEEVVKFVDQYITCSLPDPELEPELYDLVSTMLLHKHTFTCRKKQGARCRFNAPWPPSKVTIIVRGEDLSKEELKKSKKLVDRVLHEITSMPEGIGNATLDDILYSCGVSEVEYGIAMNTMQKNTTILYKRKPNEINVVPYNTVLFGLLQSNMNIQFVTGSYGLLKYLVEYLTKDDKNTSEMMKNALKNGVGEDTRNKLKKIGNIFLRNREVGLHEATKRVLSGPFRRSNIATVYIPTGHQTERIRMLKPREILEQMDPDDTNIFSTNMIEKYANRPDNLDNTCYADFATTYISKNVKETPDDDDIRKYTNPVDFDVMDKEDDSSIIILKNDLGKMRKRRKCVMRYHKPSKFSSPEDYYMVLLQLYMPWRMEDEIIGSFEKYETRFNHELPNITENILKHEPNFGKIEYDEVDFENNSNSVDDSCSEEEEMDSDNDYSAFDPSLLDFDSGFEDLDCKNSLHTSSIQDRLTIPLDSFYMMCSQLNEGQRDLLNYIMKWAAQCMLNNDNNEPDPDPFYVFLSGGAGVGKTYLVSVLIEYLKRSLLFPGQNVDECPSVAVTASTGKAACNINGATLHSSFSLPIHGENFVPKTELKGKELTYFQAKYKYLKLLIIDEISMIGKLTFDDLNIFLQQIKGNKLDFGGVCVLVIGDFFQLPPVRQSAIFTNLSLTDAWRLFRLHELIDIVRQNGDPGFASLLNRMREGNETQDDIDFVNSLSKTDVSNWPDNHCKLYITNRLKDIENQKHLAKFKQEGFLVHTILAKDSKRDIATNLQPISLKKDTPISETGNLPYSLEICEGSRVMLTVNMDVSDHLINGMIGTVVKIHRRLDSTSPSGIIFVKFDDPVAGNKYKSNRYRSDLKDCVPIEATTKQYKVSKSKKGTITGERTQFPLTAAHAMTIHKAQGSTLEYFSGDLDRSCKTPKYKAKIEPGLFYTLLSRATSSDKVRLVNFEENVIKCNEKAKIEMQRLRETSVLSCNHPLKEMRGNVICLHNIRRWDKHIGHFLSDKNYLQFASLLCFTETYTQENNFKDIKDFSDGTWCNIHRHTPHGLAICYNTDKVAIVEEEFEIEFDQLEILPIGVKVGKEHVLIVLVYRPSSFPKRLFLDQLRRQVQNFPRHRYGRIIVLGDFNLDLKSPEHISCFSELCNQFHFMQRSKWSTHKYGGILDLVFDDGSDKLVTWLPSPYSDHFILMIEM